MADQEKRKPRRLGSTGAAFRGIYGGVNDTAAGAGTVKRPPRKPKATAIPSRERKLEILRHQASVIGNRQFQRCEAPQLYDLAMAGREARGRYVHFAGIKFPCVFGFWRYIQCPETKRTLVATEGGWF
jgi:hypothetical protein